MTGFPPPLDAVVLGCLAAPAVIGAAAAFLYLFWPLLEPAVSRLLDAWPTSYDREDF